ncbi:MAG TPA: endolytic transglycosylase MltG [Candidatus Krumholzibacteria bacterium]|nr:endolytic transglycosylase MltG [Candidatus Krumholzibacteria bacterium]
MKVRSLLTMIAVFGVAGAILAFVVIADVTRPTGPAGERVRITVGPGEGFKSVMHDLTAAHLVKRAWTFEFFTRVQGHDRHIKRGTYEFTVGSPPVDVLRALVHGDILAVRVTVPEGFTSWQIAGAFRSVGVDSLDMLAAIHDPELLAALRVPVSSLEGYLFPDTYLVPYGSSAQDVVGQMLHRLSAEWTPGFARRANELNLSRHQVLTLASIVEAEAQVAEERPKVSAVYHNRLARGMRLEADPTVAYAMGGFRGRLYYKDLDIDSPYNTYRHAGLPPGPICSPGGSALHATLYPDPGERALYFVARGDGRHVFSETLREHNAAVQEWRRTRSRMAGGEAR